MPDRRPAARPPDPADAPRRRREGGRPAVSDRCPDDDRPQDRPEDRPESASIRSWRSSPPPAGARCTGRGTATCAAARWRSCSTDCGPAPEKRWPGRCGAHAAAPCGHLCGHLCGSGAEARARFRWRQIFEHVYGSMVRPADGAGADHKRKRAETGTNAAARCRVTSPGSRRGLRIP